MSPVPLGPYAVKLDSERPSAPGRLLPWNALRTQDQNCVFGRLAGSVTRHEDETRPCEVGGNVSAGPSASPSATSRSERPAIEAAVRSLTGDASSQPPRTTIVRGSSRSAGGPSTPNAETRKHLRFDGAMLSKRIPEFSFDAAQRCPFGKAVMNCARSGQCSMQSCS